MPTPEFVVITSFFNPCKFRSRVSNYKLFRKHLNAFLVTIELTNDNDFCLQLYDADLMIRVRSKSCLWQKERLLNIALENLSPTTKYIAWVDSDIVFLDLNWVNKSIELLNRDCVLIQPFKTLYDLEKNERPDNYTAKTNPTGFSFCYKVLNELTLKSDESFTPNSVNAFRNTACGLAWASKVELIKKHGFYDTMIVGSGDRMLAFAATNKLEEAINTTFLNIKRKDLYIDWAKEFFKSVQGRIGFLDTEILHLWHGDLSNRGWLDRHKMINKLGFDPSLDLTKNEFNCWELTDKNGELSKYLKQYFINRKEDS